MDKLARYLSVGEASAALSGLAPQLHTTEYVQVRNLDYVFAPFELYPLAPRTSLPLSRLAAFTVDMDGTSTTTEPLALHSLEYMVRRCTGLLTPAEWAGLDPVHDYPHVIGNSNFRHTEFLLERYQSRLSLPDLAVAFCEALAWTLTAMTDAQRRRDITLNARNCGLADLLADTGFRRLVDSGTVTTENVARLVAPLVQRYGPAFRCGTASALVGAALDVYYMRYHSILRLVEQGQGETLSRELLGEGGRHLVEPMPGYAVFLPLIKGWLGSEVDALYDGLRSAVLARPELGHTAAELDAGRPRLARLAEYFRRNPVKVALVTASIAYETHASMREVLRVVADQVAGWPIPRNCRDVLAERLADYRAVFDAFICASDACEHRLKPHRDLYSLALFQMSLARPDYAFTIGLEDTEPGIISLRAAGIGCAVALPNHDTTRQDYSAAGAVVRGGLPELMLVHNLLLDEKVTAS